MVGEGDYGSNIYSLQLTTTLPSTIALKVALWIISFSVLWKYTSHYLLHFSDRNGIPSL